MTYTNKDRIITIKYFLNNKGLDVPKGIDKMQKNALNAIILEQDIDMEEMLPLAKETYVKRENKNLIVKSKVETLTQRERDLFNEEIEKVVRRQMNAITKDPFIINTLIDDINKNLSKFIVKQKLQDKLNDIIENRPKPKWKQLEAIYEPAISVWRIPYEWEETDIDCDGDKVYYKGEEVDVKQVEKDSECVMTMNRFRTVPYDRVYERIDSDDESETSSVTYESEGSKI